MALGTSERRVSTTRIGRLHRVPPFTMLASRRRLSKLSDMISGRRGDRERGPLLWAFAASILLHALLVPLYGWTWIVRLTPAKPAHEEMVVASTAIRIYRAIPVPRSVTGVRA